MIKEGPRDVIVIEAKNTRNYCRINQRDRLDTEWTGRGMPPDTLVEPLYAALEAPLKRYATRLTHDYDQAEDLVQEAFIQAAAHLDLLGQLNGYQQRAWFYQVVKNRFIDQVRAFKRRQVLLQELADMENNAAPAMGYAGEINLFEHVPSRFKGVLVARYVLGLTSEEIAQEQHVPAATIRSRIRLAIQWLRTHPEEWN